MSKVWLYMSKLWVIYLLGSLLLCEEKVNKYRPSNLLESVLPLLDVQHKNSSQTWGAHSNPTSFYVDAPQDYQISLGEGHHHLLLQI